MISGKAVVCLGLLLVVICFFLPWVEMATVGQLMPLLQPVVALLQPYVGELLELVEQYSSLSGLELAFKAPYIPTPFRILVVLPLVMGALSLILLLISSATGGSMPESLATGLALACVLVLALLVYNIPSVERLGRASNILVSVLAALLGARLSWGFWGSLLAIILIAAGVMLDKASSTAYEDEGEYW